MVYCSLVHCNVWCSLLPFTRRTVYLHIVALGIGNTPIQGGESILHRFIGNIPDTTHSIWNDVQSFCKIVKEIIVKEIIHDRTVGSYSIKISVNCYLKMRQN